MRGLFAFLSGGIFGIGLVVAGMTDTNRVQGWLDIYGDWDPTLAFVLGGAIVPMAIAWMFTRGRSPALGGDFPAPPAPKVGRDIAVGSAMFGAGWGLAGLCPGPAVASLSFGGIGGIVFLVAMVVGMALAPPIKRKLAEMDNRNEDAQWTYAT